MTRYRIAAWIIFAVLLASCRNVGESYYLGKDEELSGNQHLVVVDAVLEEGSLVDGDLNITASKVTISAAIRGDLTVVASDLVVGPDAVIDGDLIYCMVNEGTATVSDRAVVWGKTLNQCSDNAVSPTLYKWPPTLLWAAIALFASITAGAVSALITLFAPRQMRRTSLIALEKPLLSLGFGLFTWIVALGLSLLFTLSLHFVLPVILSPLLLLLWLILLCLAVFGALSATQPIGVWIMRMLRRKEQLPLVTAITGAGTVTFAILIFNAFQPFGFVTTLALLGIASWGLGATLLTRGGMRSYHNPSERK